MDDSQKKKIIALMVFVALLVATSYYLYTKLVKPSPYYPQEELIDE